MCTASKILGLSNLEANHFHNLCLKVAKDVRREYRTPELALWLSYSMQERNTESLLFKLLLYCPDDLLSGLVRMSKIFDEITLTRCNLLWWFEMRELLRKFAEKEEGSALDESGGEAILKIRLPRLTSILSLLFLISLLLTIISPAVPHGQNACTSMPWTISTALAVLWGVCWMFYEPNPDDSPHVNGETWDWNFQSDFSGFYQFDTAVSDTCPVSGAGRLVPDHSAVPFPGDFDPTFLPFTTRGIISAEIDFAATSPALHPGVGNEFGLHVLASMLPHDKATELHTFTASSTAVLSADQSRAQAETLGWAQNVDAGLHHTSTATRVPDDPITWKTQPGDIVNHDRNGGKRHPCTKCPMTFQKKSDLARHNISKHEEDKPHICDEADCRRPFKRHDHLQNHIRAKHKARPGNELASQSAHQSLKRSANSDSFGSLAVKKRRDEPAANANIDHVSELLGFADTPKSDLTTILTELQDQVARQAQEIESLRAQLDRKEEQLARSEQRCDRLLGLLESQSGKE